MQLMASACYNPRQAVGVWERFKHMEEKQPDKMPNFLRTHPPSEQRVERIKEHVPHAIDTAVTAGCTERAHVTKRLKEMRREQEKIEQNKPKQVLIRDVEDRPKQVLIRDIEDRPMQTGPQSNQPYQPAYDEDEYEEVYVEEEED